MSERRPYVDGDPGDEDSLDEFLRWMESDMIGALCKRAKDAGLTMTLHSVPVAGPDELRAAALDSAIDRLIATSETHDTAMT